MMIEMRHYWFTAADGLIHVQNWVSCYEGQHHVHTKTQFAQWRKSVDAKNLIHIREAKSCDCGLHAGQVREGGRFLTRPAAA